jgi:hypothetical protein
VSPNSQFLQVPQDVTPQNRSFFILTAVKTSNVTVHEPAILCSGNVMCLLLGTNCIFIFQDGIFHSHRGKDLKCYKIMLII